MSAASILPSSMPEIIAQIDKQLCRIRSSSDASTSSSIGHKLRSLKDLQDCVDKWLMLPHIQQVLTQDNHERWTNEILDGTLRVLDVCSTAKDALLHTKECVRELQLILRRRGSDKTGLTTEVVRKYFTSRKVVKKEIQRALKDVQDKCIVSSEDQETKTLKSTLKEVEAITLDVFKSLLSLISGPKSKITGWSLVSKLIYNKKVACEEEETATNLFAELDAALLPLNETKSDKVVVIKNVQNQLENLDLCIQDLEEGLQYLFRHLIKTRVSLLNILNH